jgi:hypothetical protein
MLMIELPTGLERRHRSSAEFKGCAQLFLRDSVSEPALSEAEGWWTAFYRLA